MRDPNDDPVHLQCQCEAQAVGASCAMMRCGPQRPYIHEVCNRIIRRAPARDTVVTRDLASESTLLQTSCIAISLLMLCVTIQQLSLSNQLESSGAQAFCLTGRRTILG